MIYNLPFMDDPLDQGDLLDDCPTSILKEFELDKLESIQAEISLRRVIVLTQTCDIANGKADSILAATVHEAASLISSGLLKAADIKGPVRSGRVFGLYFLPANPVYGLGEMLVDFRRVHAIPPQILAKLIQGNKRIARLRTPYREHLAKHFADTYSRIGLPQPYETL